MAGALRYATSNEARDHMRDLLDAARDGRPATVRRESSRAAVIDAERLQSFLTHMNSSQIVMVAEAEGWSIMFPGTPIAADGSTVDDAVDEFIDALRDYADDWADHLRTAPNQEANWGLVQLVELSDDHQLRAWVTGA
jgi:hypothetical protein